MPIQWDAPLTAAVAKELQERLEGARLQGHVFDWERRALSLFFRSGTLRWSLHPREGWVTLEAPSEPGPGFRSLSATLVEVDAPRDERLMVFRFRKLRGRVRRVEVVVELMTNQWNGILVETGERWIRHVLWPRHLEDRSLEVGQAYRPPEPSRRAGVRTPLTEDELGRLLGGLEGSEDPGSFLEKVGFASTLNLPALRGGEDGPGAGRPIPDYHLWRRLRSQEDLEPCILETTQGKQPYPFVLSHLKYKRFSSILEAMERCSQAEDGGIERVAGRLERAMHQVKGRIRGLERELEQAGDPEETRERANLLLARLGEVNRGSSTVLLKGFGGEEVILELDPSLSAHENAQALYEEAARQERALRRLPPLIQESEMRLAELQDLERELEDGDLTLEEAEARLPRPRNRGRWQSKGQQGPRLPYRSFVSSGGLEIRVGRGPKDNDTLTFQHARADDIWLHARGTSGAHVVMRWARKETPPSRDLIEAAVLAALHSGARGSGVVPVDWTWRKYVRKPRKAKAGVVQTERSQTLFVTPDRELPARLARSD